MTRKEMSQRLVPTAKHHRIKGNFIPLYIMAFPGLLYLLINNYLPMIGLFVAFKNVNYAVGLFKSEWIGFKNFEFLFKSNSAFIITRNTILYNLAFIVILTTVSVLFAILLNEVKNKVVLSVYQSLILLPYLISMIIVSYLAFAFLSNETGFINNTLLPKLGMEKIMWYTEPKYWPYILTFINTWKNFGFTCVIYLASIVGIDMQLYEAAKLDGASKLQQIFHITIPLIKPTIIVMVLLAIGKIFYSDFGLFYQIPLNSGPLIDVTNTIDTYVSRGLRENSNIGMSAAAGLYQSVVGFVLVLGANLLVKHFSEGNELF